MNDKSQPTRPLSEFDAAVRDFKLMVGDLFGRGRPSEQDALILQALFALCGRLAAADGITGFSETAFIDQLMDDHSLGLSGRSMAMEAYERGKTGTVPTAKLVESFVEAHPRGSSQSEQLLSNLAKLAACDGRVLLCEKQMLGEIAAALGYSASELDVRMRMAEHN